MGLEKRHKTLFTRAIWNSFPHLHEEYVLVAVEPEHIVVNLGEGAVPGLAVEEADVARVDFVLVLDGGDQAGHGGGDLEIKGDIRQRRCYQAKVMSFVKLVSLGNRPGFFPLPKVFLITEW